ncbi:hypothetical protein MKZ38_002258 [Zalerion maritima]|uniref:Uncharacterized protein n=1 Tax=Zalerion maritima TaxID=339359 RepID=A0AAD5RPX2_9PEZI|nr:hypothetical protein MKZ38_002258 [Zalerion maritima]
MAANNTATPRPGSPSHGKAPTPALGPAPPMQRCVSTASTASQGSNSDVRGSMGSTSSRQSSITFASSTSSRHSDLSMLSGSSAQNPNNRATIHVEKPRKSRGYVRPQGTDFAASARQRESVLSLGSIAHLQYYFARTGLLDGKGGHVQRSRKQRARPATLDLSLLRSDSTTSPRLSLLSPKLPGDTPPGSLGGSPDLVPAGVLAGSMVQSPVEANGDIDGEFDSQFFLDEYDEPDPSMPPPTTSTYNNREKPVQPPPSILELKTELRTTLNNAAKALEDVTLCDASSQSNPPERGSAMTDSPKGKAQPAGWHEIQGVHVLDVVTLAIRAARNYYTAHPHPDRLDAVKPERELRADLLSVMDTLRKSASRSFANGFKSEELEIMTEWIASVRDMLAQEHAVEDAERKKREAWSWLRGDWTGRETEREVEFLKCMLAAPHTPVGDEPLRKVSSTKGAASEKEAKEKEEKRKSALSIPDNDPLPEFTPASSVPEDQLPTMFLAHFRSGTRLVRLHNAAVRASRRRFGAIGTYHKDTSVTYRSAENIRFWAKAAELRWEAVLKLDALAVAQGSGGPTTWTNFEKAILDWARRVRTEIAGEMED